MWFFRCSCCRAVFNSPSLLKHKKRDDEIPLTSKIPMVGGGVPPLIVQIVHKSPTSQAINALKSRQMPLSSRGFRGPGVVSMGIYMLIHALYNVFWEAFLEGLNGVNRRPSNGPKINRQPSKTQYFYRQPSNEQAKISRQISQISLNDRDCLT